MTNVTAWWGLVREGLALPRVQQQPWVAWAGAAQMLAEVWATPERTFQARAGLCVLVRAAQVHSQEPMGTVATAQARRESKEVLNGRCHQGSPRPGCPHPTPRTFPRVISTLPAPACAQDAHSERNGVSLTAARAKPRLAMVWEPHLAEYRLQEPGETRVCTVGEGCWILSLSGYLKGSKGKRDS